MGFKFNLKLVNLKQVMPLLSLLLLFPVAVMAVDELNTADQLALKGYDPVSYFDGKPVKGDPAVSSMHNNAEYYFISQKNKDRFRLMPEQYSPMYGGFCAYGVRMGKKLDIDPLAFEINDGHLYVLLNRSTHKMWKQDMEKNIQISDMLWPQIQIKSVGSLN